MELGQRLGAEDRRRRSEVIDEPRRESSTESIEDQPAELEVAR